jgi:hypothetical protein
MPIFSSSPTIVLCSAETRAEQNKPVLIEFTTPDGKAGIAIPLFTCLETAERFIMPFREAGKGMAPAQFPANVLGDFLAAMEKQGVTHVNVDAGQGRPAIPIGKFFGGEIDVS